MISNERLWQHTYMPVEQEIQQRRWGWIGPTLHKPVDIITRQTLTWISDRMTANHLARDLEAGVKETGYTWRKLETLALD